MSGQGLYTFSRVPRDVTAYHEALELALSTQETRTALEALWQAVQLYLEPEVLGLAIRLLLPWPELAAGYARLGRLIYPDYALDAGPIGSKLAQDAQLPNHDLLPDWLQPWADIIAPARLSVCMIVRDEAASLPGCLASLGELPDEIVIVDTGSVDGTQELARAHPKVRLYEMAWGEDFAAARNHSLAQATGDWILVFDADERLDAESLPILAGLKGFMPLGWQNYLSQVRQQLADGSNAFSLATRLFRNHPALRFSGALHERLIKQDSPPWLLQIRVPLSVSHWGNLPEVYRQKRKAERVHLLERLASDPATANPYLQYQYAFLLVNGIDTEADWPRAEALLLQALNESEALAGALPPRPDWQPADPAAVALLLAQIYGGSDRQRDMIALYERFGDRCLVTAFVGLAAHAYQAEGRLDQAWATWLRCFDPGLQPLREPETWREHALERLLEIALQRQDGLLALWAVRRLRERWPEGRVPSKAYDLVHLQRKLEAGLSLPPGTWLDRCEFELQQALGRRDIAAVAWHAMAYLCESWDRTVLGDALRAMHLLGNPALVYRIARLGQCLYPDEALFAQHAPLPDAKDDNGYGQAAPMSRELCNLPGGAYWLQLIHRPQPRPRLSVCMIVRDAAETLLDALRSVEALADEYVIADTGSNDETRAIIAAWAESHAIVSWDEPWREDFAAARNAVLERASGDWILSLDADEQLRPESVVPLRGLLAYAPAGLQRFALRILSPQSDEQSLRDWVARLFPRHELIRYWGAFHEQLSHAQDAESLPVIPLSAAELLHSGYRPEAMARHRKYERQALFAKTLEIQGLPNPYYLFHYAYALLYHRDPPETGQAFALLEQSLRESEKYHHRPPVPGWFAAPLGKVRLLLLRLLAHWQRDQELLARYRAWGERHSDPEYHFWAAGAALRLDDPALAEAAFRRCLSAPEPALPQAGFGSWRPRLGLAELALRQGDWPSGIQAYQELIASGEGLGHAQAQQYFSEWWQKMKQRWGMPGTPQIY